MEAKATLSCRNTQQSTAYASTKIKGTTSEWIKSPTAEESCCAALRKEEPDEANLQMRAKGALGADFIPSTFL